MERRRPTREEQERNQRDSERRDPPRRIDYAPRIEDLRRDRQISNDTARRMGIVKK